MDYQIVSIEDVKKGDFFRRLRKGEPASKTYQKDGYCRLEKKYIGNDWDDISGYTALKKGTKVAVGFDF